MDKIAIKGNSLIRHSKTKPTIITLKKNKLNENNEHLLIQGLINSGFSNIKNEISIVSKSRIGIITPKNIKNRF